MRLKLNNLIYTTSNPTKALKLQEMGAVVIDGEDEIQKQEEKIDLAESNLKNLTNDDLKELLRDKGIDFKANMTKDELIQLLK